MTDVQNRSNIELAGEPVLRPAPSGVDITQVHQGDMKLTHRPETIPRLKRNGPEEHRGDIGRDDGHAARASEGIIIRTLTCDELIKEHSEREDVAPRVGPTIVCLRRCIPRRPRALRDLGRLLVGDRTKPERTRQPRRTDFGQHHLGKRKEPSIPADGLGLQVEVLDPTLVRSLKRFGAGTQTYSSGGAAAVCRNRRHPGQRQ